MAVEFYSSSVLKELKGEEEMGRDRFSGGSEGGMTALWFGSSRVEEGGSQRHTARQSGRRGSGADGSQRWEPMQVGGGSRRPGGPYWAKRPSGAGRFRGE
jgi:hypothetical protein